MIKLNDVVTLHYSVYTQDGVNLDTSRDGEPLLAMIGSRLLIEGLEQAIIGKVKGDTFEVSLNPEQAYGPRHDNLVQTVPLSMFEGIEVEPGMSFRATTEEGEQSVIVIEVDDETAVVDGNHPLAGVPLSFDVEILDVRAPTESELKNGKAYEKSDSQH
jgi:FKBP-type peptidyl-prolyl cis-trans isomerase SlyD